MPQCQQQDVGPSHWFLTQGQALMPPITYSHNCAAASIPDPLVMSSSVVPLWFLETPKEEKAMVDDHGEGHGSVT